MYPEKPKTGQVALLVKPELVLDLLGFGLSEASGGFESVFGIRLDRPINAPSVDEGFVRVLRLDHGIDAGEYWQKGTRVKDLSEAFAAFRESGKKTRNAQITEAIARTLPYRAGGAEFFGLIADEAGADIRKHWTPTAENFSRGSQPVIWSICCASSLIATPATSASLPLPSSKRQKKPRRWKSS